MAKILKTSTGKIIKTSTGKIVTSDGGASGYNVTFSTRTNNNTWEVSKGSIDIWINENTGWPNYNLYYNYTRVAGDIIQPTYKIGTSPYTGVTQIIVQCNCYSEGTNKYSLDNGVTWTNITQEETTIPITTDSIVKFETPYYND